MQTLRIRPVAGRVVRDPDLHDLVTEPREVPDTSFWRRRIRDGDLATDESPPSVPTGSSQAAEVSAHDHGAAKASHTKRSTDGGQQ
ncbi:DUF2635 domain-containing protein [Paraburkholderia mimosarum]|uniref:DUF2635 domain-containing protein n=1 Tax=Paraburkholderia mimosarum TaxID=312026 RepID=UPI0003F6CC8F|nr:DUF2635 domain-containing protein [Paraburkholderia mimosarum]